MKFVFPSLAVAALFSLMAASVQAADGAASAPAGALPEACRQDVQTLCTGTQPGEGRIAACLREKRKELSDGCKTALKAQRGQRKRADK